MSNDIIIKLRLSPNEASLVAGIFEIAAERYAALAKEESARKSTSSADQAIQWQTFCSKVASEFRLALEPPISRSIVRHQDGSNSHGIGQD